MSRHWQRRPLLVRQAIPGFIPPVTVDEVLALAARDDVESRLVTSRRGRWRLAHGPFERTQIPPPTQRHWTVLIQGVDLHLAPVHALLGRFRFVSDARLDDLMISVAGDGGGVGPHIDAYDVFLLQATGRRRWRIAPTGYPRRQPALRDDVPLKMMQPFAATAEWVLEPGDMLYLPPGYAHEGIADGPCSTWSIGFRAPSRLEFLRAFLAECADDPEGPDPRHGDRGTQPTRHPGALPADMYATMQRWAREWRPSSAAIDRCIGRYLTEPKSNVWFDAPDGRIDRDRFRALLAGGAVELDPRTRMIYRGRSVFINGERFAPPAAALLRRLADDRRLDAEVLRRALGDGTLDETLVDHLYRWWAAGWLRHHSAGRNAGRTRPAMVKS